jgi:phospholipid/cholesterol/gamma-HCH transport system substrate-binding protein
MFLRRNNVAILSQSAHRIFDHPGDAIQMNIGVGLGTVLGFAAMVYMWAQFPGNSTLSRRTQTSYVVSAAFDDVGPLTVAAPVKIAGFKVGYVKAISLQPQGRKAVVLLCLNAGITTIPKDSAASIRTAGLLGGAYLVITPGAAATYLRPGSNMDITESAFSLEHLMKGLTEAAIR